MKRKVIMSLLLGSILYIFPAIVHAQAPDPGGDPDKDAGAPFDPGVAMLIATGVGYVANKGYYLRRKTKLKDQVK